MGNERAFEIVYRRYARELYNFARKSIPVSEDCREIVQDIFESLWTRREQLNVQNLSAYLFSSARYKVIRYFQHSKVRRKYEDHYRFFEILYEHSADLQMSAGEASAIIQRCVRELPQRYQEVMNFRLQHELSNEDIAKRMNVTTQTVEIYLSNAISKLKAVYKTYYSSKS